VEYLRDIDGAFYWFEKNVVINPDEILDMLELLITRLSEISEKLFFHGAGALVTTLRVLLQEADLSGDEQFINRVLAVQNWFLDQGLSEVETMLES